MADEGIGIQSVEDFWGEFNSLQILGKMLNFSFLWSFIAEGRARTAGWRFSGSPVGPQFQALALVFSLKTPPLKLCT